MPLVADWTVILSSQDTAKKSDSFLDRFFKISERGSTVGREIRGGLVTFFAMAYILVVNAAILGVAAPKDISQSAIAAGTALVACVMTLLSRKLPAGLGLRHGAKRRGGFHFGQPRGFRA